MKKLRIARMAGMAAALTMVLSVAFTACNGKKMHLLSPSLKSEWNVPMLRSTGPRTQTKLRMERQQSQSSMKNTMRMVTMLR